MIRLRSNLKPNDWTQGSMTRIYLIRPGSTCFDLDKRITGNLDLPLCPEGLAQIDRLKQELADVPLAAIYHCPNLAAERTAEALGPALKLRPKCVADLRNFDMGLWQGLCWEELKQRHPKAWRQWLDDPNGLQPPRGELVEDVTERIAGFLDIMLRRHRDEMVAIVAPDPLAQILASQLKGCPKPRLTETLAGGTIEVIDLELDDAGRRKPVAQTTD